MKNKIIYSIITLLAVSLFSCRKDFEEINKNPNGFSTSSDGSLFNAIISSVKSGWSEQLYVNISVLYKENQQGALPFVRWNNYSIGTEELWSNYYTTLPNFRELESRWADKDSTSHYLQNMMAMEKILLAYKTFKMTDLFGDIPYSQAGYGYKNFNQLRPEFDTQEKIYTDLLGELEWAANHIDPVAVDKDPFLTFKSFDNLFGGDMAKWRKLANSLRLRYAMRMSSKIPRPALADSVVRDVIMNNRPCFGVNEFGMLNDNPYTESALLFPYQLGYRNESKGWSFDQSKEMRMGSTIWGLMTRFDSADGSGIFDPRAYYFFETNINSKWKAYPNNPAVPMQPDGGDPYNYQRDVAYSIKGSGCLYSPVNYYLERDMDYIPEILMTGTEVLYLRAEAYMRGVGVAKDAGQAGTEFLGGIQFSLHFWETIMNNSKLPIGTPFSANISVPSSVNFISLQSNLNYFMVSESEQLDKIYAQSWLDFFMQPQQAFALARRTQRTPHEGNPSTVYRFPIPPSEVSYNQTNWLNAFGQGGDVLSRKVWWMN